MEITLIYMKILNFYSIITSKLLKFSLIFRISPNEIEFMMIPTSLNILIDYPSHRNYSLLPLYQFHGSFWISIFCFTCC